MCTVELDLSSTGSTYPMAEIYWYDADGKVLDQVMGAGFGKADYHLSIYSQVPAGPSRAGSACELGKARRSN